MDRTALEIVDATDGALSAGKASSSTKRDAPQRSGGDRTVRLGKAAHIHPDGVVPLEGSIFSNVLRTESIESWEELRDGDDGDIELM